MADEKPSVITAADGLARCWWCGDDPDYVAYHDNEWGRPVLDDTRLFEKVCLEGFQSGLSWLTILRKREGFRAAFKGFEIDAVAEFGEKDVERLLQDAGIVRHRKKIESAINNARAAQKLRAEFGALAPYFYQFRPAAEERPKKLERGSMPGKVPSSERMSKDMKKRGWSFVGPTTAYAFMQAMGLVNDHVEGCHHRDEVQKQIEDAAKAFT